MENMMMKRTKKWGIKMKNGMPLPDDVLIELLVYLPVKSLMRFRCISKYWCALIKTPAFVNRHLKCDCEEYMLLKRYLPPQDSNEIRRDGENIISFHNSHDLDFWIAPNLPIPFLKDIIAHEAINLLGPCDGLVCLECFDIIIFCNPALREFELLPPSPFAYPDAYVDRIEGSGFGYDSKSNCYKLVRMHEIDENLVHFADVDDFYYHRPEDSYKRVDLYNSSTDSWKVIDAVVPDIWYNPGFDVYFNGACHWQANIPIEEPPPVGTILCFDFSTESFRLFEFPDFDDNKYCSLVIINQCLSEVRYAGWDGEPQDIDIWVMKEYGIKDSWTKELIVAPYVFRRSFLSWKNEWLLVETSESQFACCSLRTDEVKTSQVYGLEGSLRAVIFTESIISLNQILFKKD